MGFLGLQQRKAHRDEADEWGFWDCSRGRLTGMKGVKGMGMREN